jgi:KipI family sensor histidine kinase inhibitor
VARAAAPARFLASSDRALLVRFAERASPTALARVRNLMSALAERPIGGVVHWQPAYASLLVHFDPLRTDSGQVENEVRDRLDEPGEPRPPDPPREIEVPVAYGGEHGPDLESVAAHCGLSPEPVIAAHSSALYDVDFFGFVPGFAYLSGLPETLATPRLAEPRRRVEAGSVAIGGAQTAIYPAPTPGGWRLIGRTPLRPARFEHQPWTLFVPGDRLRFVAISAADFARLNQWR